MTYFIIRYTLIMLYLFYNLYKKVTYFGMEGVVANEYDPMPHFPTPFKPKLDPTRYPRHRQYCTQHTLVPPATRSPALDDGCHPGMLEPPCSIC
jgi:hypothetical protein